MCKISKKLYVYYSGVLKCYSQLRECRPWCSRLSKLTEAPCTPGCGGVTYRTVTKNDNNLMKVYQRHGGGNFAQNGLIGGGDEGDFLLG